MSEKLLEEFKNLEAENKELRQELSKLKGETPQEKTSDESLIPAESDWGDPGINLVDSDKFNEIVIPEDYGILIMCMVDHVLVLREQQRGGREYKFPAGSFGKKMHIPFSDMKLVFEYNKKFFDKGIFAILTQDFLAKYGIVNAALPVGTMQRMIEGKVPADEFIDLYRAMPASQREEVMTQMVRAYIDNPEKYTGYFLSRLESDLGLQIHARAKAQKDMLKAYQETAYNG